MKYCFWQISFLWAVVGRFLLEYMCQGQDVICNFYSTGWLFYRLLMKK